MRLTVFGCSNGDDITDWSLLNGYCCYSNFMTVVWVEFINRYVWYGSKKLMGCLSLDHLYIDSILMNNTILYFRQRWKPIDVDSC